eukprot:UN31945
MDLGRFVDMFEEHDLCDINNWNSLTDQELTELGVGGGQLLKMEKEISRPRYWGNCHKTKQKNHKRITK